MNKHKINAVHDDDLEKLLEKLGLLDKIKSGQIKCKFTGTIISLNNLYSIFPQSGSIKVVCDSPIAIKLFTEYCNENGHKSI